MTETFPLPYADSYWVAPGELMAGEYPGGYEEAVIRRRIISLLRCGVNTFVDLTRPGDSQRPYQVILSEEADLYQKKVNWLNFPILDFSIPSIDQMNKIIAAIHEHITEGNIVYVHCLAGIGRTGMVVGCYLVNQGLSGQEALMQIKHLRRNTPSWWHSSPENEEQVSFILNWENAREKRNENSV